MGLIAREIESRGVPTLSMSSAWSITHKVNPPRAVFLDFPLGHTAGRPDEPGLNAEILRATLAAFESIQTPGEIVPLPFSWSEDDAWKNQAMAPRAGQDDTSCAASADDDRIERFDTPQYQDEADRAAAEATLAAGGCATCIDPA